MSSVETYQNTIKQQHIQTLQDNFLDKTLTVATKGST